jgi:thioredoxin
MKFRIFLILFNIFLITSCKGQTKQNFESIAPASFSKKITEESKPQIIDVRTSEEFDGGHINNAINQNWNSTDFEANALKYDKTKPVFVYCLSGGRSKKAAEKFVSLGFEKVYELQGGIMKWNADGFAKPLDKNVGMSVEAFNELLNGDRKVLISFYADWCAPCKKMAPYLLKLQKDWATKVVIVRINADENKTLVADLKINELPTLILYEKKAMKWRKSGFISEENLKKQIQ